MARTLELDTITEPSNTGTANITLSSNTTTTMPLVDINGGAIDGTTLGVASPSSVAATTLSTTGNATVGGTLGVTGTATMTGTTTMNGDVNLGNASSDTVTVTGTMAGIDNKSGMTGEIRMWGGASEPTGWLFCDGDPHSRSTYSALFAITGTAFGIGDGSSTFNVPDMRGRMPVGVGSAGAGGALEDADGGTVPAGGDALEVRSLGEWSGAEKLTTAQLAAHTHTSAAHTHTGASHTHTGPSHSHTGSAHTHTGASHRHLTYVEGGSNRTTVGGTAGLNGNDYSSNAHYTNYVTPGAGGSTTPGAGGSSGTGATGGTTPGAGGSTTPGASGSSGSTSKFTTPIMCVNFIIKT